MGSNARAVLEKFVETIRTVNGGNDYTYNLSDTHDRVLGASVWPPSVLPCVMIQDTSISSEHQGASGRYKRRMDITLIGWVASAENTPGSRALAACDLLDDVMLAIEADRTVGGTVLDVIFTNTTAIDGFEETGAELGAFGAIASVYWLVTTGV